ncbi:MAG: hypothetical protein KDJ35_06975 [Alphaproteobacteria bacterium]|nr:hypothetical protein [Alphaproteobacteria bacterium]
MVKSVKNTKSKLEKNVKKDVSRIKKFLTKHYNDCSAEDWELSAHEIANVSYYRTVRSYLFKNSESGVMVEVYKTGYQEDAQNRFAEKEHNFYDFVPKSPTKNLGSDHYFFYER